MLKRSHGELTTALSEFQQFLSPEQTAQLDSFSSHAPTADDITRLTEEVIQANSSRKSRLFASRLQGLLNSVQQYCTIVDTCVGPNQIAALVWGSIKVFLLVCTPYCYSLILAYITLTLRFHQISLSISISCQCG